MAGSQPLWCVACTSVFQKWQHCADRHFSCHSGNRRNRTICLYAGSLALSALRSFVAYQARLLEQVLPILRRTTGLNKYKNSSREGAVFYMARQLCICLFLFQCANDQHASGKENNARKIWTVFTFLVWYKRFFIDFILPIYN